MLGATLVYLQVLAQRMGDGKEGRVVGGTKHTPQPSPTGLLDGDDLQIAMFGVSDDPLVGGDQHGIQRPSCCY